jgi:catechol 2,3-dioxygenase-like lactoylglutathione lyase family enzyme
MDAASPTRWTTRVEVPDPDHRRYWHELGVVLRAAHRLRDDPGLTHEVFNLLENFPVRDLLRRRTLRLPLLRDPRLLALYEAGSMPDLRTERLPELLALPAGTLGHEYARFAQSRGLDNIFLEYLQVDSPLHWLIYRIGHLHDLFHFILGYDPYDPIGEMEVEVFLHAQHGAPNHLLFLLGYLRFLLRNDPGQLRRGWRRLRAARRDGRAAEPLLLVRWEDQLARPLDAVRRDLGIAHRPVCRPQAPPAVTPRVAHVVFNVPDLARATTFYTRVFGYEIATHDHALGVTFLTAGDDHHTIALQECLSLHPLRFPASAWRGLKRGAGILRAHLGGETSRLSGRRRVLPPPRIVLASLRRGHNHTGFRVTGDADLRGYVARLRAFGTPIVWAVNHGDMIKGVYFRDPAGNLCELFVDGPLARDIRARLAAGEKPDVERPDDLPTFELDLEAGE